MFYINEQFVNELMKKHPRKIVFLRKDDYEYNLMKELDSHVLDIRFNSEAKKLYPPNTAVGGYRQVRAAISHCVREPDGQMTRVSYWNDWGSPYQFLSIHEYFCSYPADYGKLSAAINLDTRIGKDVIDECSKSALVKLNVIMHLRQDDVLIEFNYVIHANNHAAVLKHVLNKHRNNQYFGTGQLRPNDAVILGCTLRDKTLEPVTRKITI